MARPDNLHTRIFLDSGDPDQTQQALSLLGFLDGQTTNPSLVAKNPQMQEKIAQGNTLNSEEVSSFYQGVVKEISTLIPNGSVSIEVYADKQSTAEDMLSQARDMYRWIPNAHIKFPTTKAGLQAAQTFIKEDKGRVNMTLVFSLEQCAAVYAATSDAKKGEVFVSPFVGRLDDKGIDGMSLIHRALELYKNGDDHVEVLVASVRNMDHFLYSIALDAHIITAPLSILEEWAKQGMPIPDKNFVYEAKNLTPLAKSTLNLQEPWETVPIEHELTDVGLQRFADDWNTLIGKHI